MIQNVHNKSNMKQVGHNGIIAIWKFLFAIMIIFRHVEASNTYFSNYKYTFIAGSIAVEFFFIVSGYLMAKKALSMNVKSNEIGKETFNYIMKKLRTFFPYILIAVIVSVISKALMGYNDSVSNLINYIFDILMIPMILIWHTRSLGIEWYISAMLIAMMILYPLILKYKKNFIYVISPLIFLLTLGFISRMDGTLAGVDVYYFGFLPKGLVRAISMLSLGSITYLITEKIKLLDFTFFGKLILTVIEVVGFSSIFYIVNVPGAHYKYDFVMVFIFFISTIVAFSEKSLFIEKCNNKLFYYLEKISLPMYLNHMWIINIFNFIFKNQKVNYYIASLGIIFVTLIMSILITYVIDKGFNNKILKQKISKLILKTQIGEDKNDKEKI